MNNNDFERFANALGSLMEIHGKELSPLAIKTFFNALSEFPIEDVEKAVLNAFTKCKWFPKPVELIEMITGGAEAIEDTALYQAGLVLKAIKKIGPYKTVCFDDAVTQAVITNTFGGWVKMCQDSQIDQEKWFIKISASLTALFPGKISNILEHLQA